MMTLHPPGTLLESRWLVLSLWDAPENRTDLNRVVTTMRCGDLATVLETFHDRIDDLSWMLLLTCRGVGWTVWDLGNDETRNARFERVET